MTFTCSLCSAQAPEKFFLLIPLRTASPETLPEGSFLGQPVIAVREHREVGEAPPALPTPHPTPPQAQVLDFPHPSPAFPGWGGGPHCPTGGKEQALLGRLLCARHGANPSTSSTSFSPHDILGG